MEEPQTITTAMVRQAMRGFCADIKDHRVSNAQLYEAMGLTQECEKARLRSCIADMTLSGETIKISPGLYEYNFKYRSRENTSYPAIWRFVRTQKPGWSISYACQLTRVSYSRTARYIAWLENEGFVTRHGKDSKTTLYHATDKADRTPETPYPPLTDRNPFEKENAAAARLATLMLCHDPYQPRVAAEIVKHCKTLLARFAKNTKEEPHA
ncbi:MAG: hypothetical protein LBJ14_10420 [Desulfarculales bacterium]|jgi:hypothetical protein|nr:hypothetical protein [Desulfarculales bacterium]